MTVTIKVLDTQWVELWSFPWEDNKVFTTMAKEHNVDIPLACGSWACGVCLCKIVAWWAYIEKNKIGEHLIPVADDEVLTCVSWITSEALGDEENHSIILQRKI